jgi:cyclase
MHSFFKTTLAACLFMVPTTGCAEEVEAPRADVVNVRGPISMIQAGGGNIGIFAGEDGVFMIDSSYAKDAPEVDAALKSITNGPVKILMNTHWHQDHTGGNAHVNEKGAKLIAHKNVKKRLETGQRIEAFDRVVGPAEEAALPEETYTEANEMVLNGHTFKIIPAPYAHTDGDSYVYWPDLNVVHAGDLFFNGFWPFIDYSSGGDIYGMIAATDQILMLADDETRIIPGHGPVAGKAELLAYNNMLRDVADKVSTAKAAEQTVDEFMATSPLASYEDEWGGGFLLTPKFIRIVWDGVNLEMDEEEDF